MQGWVVEYKKITNYYFLLYKKKYTKILRKELAYKFYQ